MIKKWHEQTGTTFLAIFGILPIDAISRNIYSNFREIDNGGYIDLNMVRAGVVKHPEEGPFDRYWEIQQPPKRYRLIDREALVEKYGGSDGMEEFRQTYKNWVNESLNDWPAKREPVWSESIAVVSERFIAATREELDYLANGRKIIENDDTFPLSEPHTSYNTDFYHQNSLLSFENAYYWNDFNE